MAVRYIVNDVAAAVAFYTEHLGFRVAMGPVPGFRHPGPRGPAPAAQRAREPVEPAMRERRSGSPPAPGGWNRFQLEVADLDDEVERLRGAGVSVPGRRGGGRRRPADPRRGPLRQPGRAVRACRAVSRSGCPSPARGRPRRPVGRVCARDRPRALADRRRRTGVRLAPLRRSCRPRARLSGQRPRRSLPGSSRGRRPAPRRGRARSARCASATTGRARSSRRGCRGRRRRSSAGQACSAAAAAATRCSSSDAGSRCAASSSIATLTRSSSATSTSDVLRVFFVAITTPSSRQRPRTQFSSSVAPASPDFSGWNWVAARGPFSTAATNGAP